jgi:hypothetical protein
MLTAEAEWLVVFDDLAQACAECFARARCAGLDVKAIGQTAKAAVVLGASLDQLRAQLPAYPSDAGYLEEIEVVREAIRQRIGKVRSLMGRARDVQHQAGVEMRRAIRDRDWPRYRFWLAIWVDATRALFIAGEGLRTLEQADRCLQWARIRFAEAYEGAESDVSRGVQLPHEGRWITS